MRAISGGWRAYEVHHAREEAIFGTDRYRRDQRAARWSTATRSGSSSCSTRPRARSIDEDSAQHDPVGRLHSLVRRAEGRRRDLDRHASSRPAPRRRRRRAGRLWRAPRGRWTSFSPPPASIPANGVQIVAADRLAAPRRPRPAGDRAGHARRGVGARSTSRSRAPRAARAGRGAGRALPIRIRSLARFPTVAPVSIGTLDDAILGGRTGSCRPRSRRTTLPRPMAWPPSAPGFVPRMAARGTGARTIARCGRTCWRRRTRRSTPSSGARRRISPRSSATSTSRSSSTPSSRRRTGSST